MQASRRIPSPGNPGAGDHGQASRRCGKGGFSVLELVHDPQDGVAACEHLAIHYERNARDLQRAVEFAQLALAKLQRQYTNPRDPYATARAARAEKKLLCRLERLRHRIERRTPGVLTLRCSRIQQPPEPVRALVDLPFPLCHTLEFGGTNRMETSATKRQAIAEDKMATTENSYFLRELELRREHLLSASRANTSDHSLRDLLASVDAALSHLQKGTFGICETCHEPIEADRLLCNPLLRFCLDHLSGDEQRALERDLTLAARIQRALLPPTDWSSAGWQARYHYQPAGLVSGDYCDLIESDGAFLFLLGDVAGKGVAASMLMSHLHATFRSLAGQHLSLQHMVELANRFFCESTTAGQYATICRVGDARRKGDICERRTPSATSCFIGWRPRARSYRRAVGNVLHDNFQVCELTLCPATRCFFIRTD